MNDSLKCELAKHIILLEFLEGLLSAIKYFLLSIYIYTHFIFIGKLDMSFKKKHFSCSTIGFSFISSEFFQAYKSLWNHIFSMKTERTKILKKKPSKYPQQWIWL